MKKRLALFVSILMLAGLALAGCATSTPTAAPATSDAAVATSAAADQTATPAPAAAAEKELRMNLGDEPVEMNSMLTTDTLSLTVLRHCQEGLVRLGPNNERQPGMATSWDISADGLTYTFHLRDAKWSNGDPVTASDFAFAFKTILNPDTGASYSYLGYLIKGGQEYNSKKGTEADLGIKVVDEKTLEITLARPADYFLDVCAFGVFGPVNQKFYEQVGADKYGKEANQMLSNGPFILDKWTHQDSMHLTKNPNYWDAANVKISGIEMKMIKDSNTALNSFLAGDLDMVGVTGAQIQSVKDSGFDVKQYGDGATFYIEFNVRDKIGDAVNPTSNINIRQALCYALDRNGFITTVLKNSSKPALSFTTPEIAGKTKPTFPDEVAPLIKDNDPAAAKAAFDKGLQELGLTADQIKISMLSDDTDVAKNVAAYYQECWKRNLGITVEIDTQPFKSRIEKLQSDNFMISSSGWGPDYNDPMTFLDMFETGNGNNHTGYSSADYDALLNQARNEKDHDKRYDIYFQMEKLLMTDMPIAPVYFRVRDFTTVAELQGVTRNAFQDINVIWAYFTK